MIKRAFVRGLLALTPVAITFAVLIWLYNLIENFVGGLYKRYIGEQYYFEGLGVLIVFALIFLVGIIINNWLMRKIYSGFEKLLDKLPFVKTLYRSVVDLMSLFKGNSQMKESRVVMVLYQNSKVLGLVSRDSFEDLPKGVGQEGEVAVYIPMSYQIGGFTVIVPKSMIQPIDMGIEEGLRFAVTAAMPGQAKEGSAEDEPKK
ncbi:MAG: hypothetical protein S4CHLAM7_12890 [Chlamydiae bacterium]|nr:hypothetical protein [Chlamydiota bacterium]